MPFVFVTGAASQYLGAAIGVFLFSTTQPATVAWLRAAAGALVLAAWRRPWRMRLTRRRVTIATLFGLITVGMNIAFYEALARIPPGHCRRVGIHRTHPGGDARLTPTA